MGLLYMVGASTTYFFYISQIVCTSIAALLFVISVVLCITLYRSKRAMARPTMNAYLIEM